MAVDFGSLVLNASPDAVIVTSPEGVVECWTSAAQAVYGYSPAQAEGRTLAELTVPAELASFERAIIGITCEQGSARYEALRRRMDGTMVFIESASKVVRGDDGKLAYIVWSQRDITDNRVGRDIKQMAIKFGDVLEYLPDPIVLTNATGRIVLVNAQAAALFGYERSAMCGMQLEALMPERFRQRHRQHRARYATAPEPRRLGQGRAFYALRKNGEEFPIEISLSPLQTESGVMYMGSLREAASPGRAAPERFLASVSHELRTPLNAIIGFAGTLLMKLPGPLTDDQDRQVRTIQSSARQLLALINDLLDLSTIDAGGMPVLRERVRCQDVLEELAGAVRPAAAGKGLEVTVECPAQPLELDTDRRVLLQILMHIANNAVKYTDAGAVRLRLATLGHGGAVSAAFTVSDTGVGIAQADHARLFRPFVPLGSRPERSGAGLGLHLSQKLAALLGGHIMFDSQPGIGSVFTLVLPVLSPARTALAGV